MMLVVAVALAVGCAAKRQITQGESDQLDAIAAKIARAENMDARECAPKELATAKVELDHARHEATESFYSQAKIQEYIKEADVAADTLLAKTLPCWEANQHKRMDRDGDGVPDHMDKCPYTPAGVAVDSSGCPKDSDGDGVADYIDRCPNTPAGVSVNPFGCPIDSDGDGVPDFRDQCPDTPLGAAVDRYGCSADSDGDGVPDNLDKCPDTPAGTPVNEDGCSLTK